MLERMINPWSILFKKPPEQLPPMTMRKRNGQLEGVVTNIKLLYKFVHEQANITKADEHLWDARLEAMLNIVDDIKSRLLESNVAEKKETRTGELRRCSSSIATSSMATASSSASLAPMSVPVIKPLDPPIKEHTTKTKPGLFLITPPSSPSAQPHKIMTPPISPKPRRAPPPLSVPAKASFLETSSNINYDAIVQENNQLKRKLASALLARDSAEKVCKTIYKDTESVTSELHWRMGQLEEANETVKYLSALNQRLYNKVSGQGTVEGLTEELVDRNKELMQRIEKAREEYNAILGTVKEGLELNKRLALEMESCIDMLCKVRTERGKEDIPQFLKMKKIMGKLERYLTSWQVRLRDSPLKNID